MKLDKNKTLWVVIFLLAVVALVEAALLANYKYNKSPKMKITRLAMPHFTKGKRVDYELHPLTRINRMQHQMNRIFDQHFFQGKPDFNRPIMEWKFQPAVDISENPRGYTMKIDLPGMDKTAINVKVAGNSLVVSGRRKHQQQQQEQTAAGKMWVQERASGYFARRIQLPPAVDKKAIEANYENGVLTVIMPKNSKNDGAGNNVFNIEVN
jgi:HSP20 family protein